MPYTPTRGGHAPGHLREAFIEWAEAGCDPRGIVMDAEDRPVRWIVGQLWNCTDVMPHYVCDTLGLRHGSTYAMAVRFARTLRRC